MIINVQFSSVILFPICNVVIQILLQGLLYYTVQCLNYYYSYFLTTPEVLCSLSFEEKQIHCLIMAL